MCVCVCVGGGVGVLRQAGSTTTQPPGVVWYGRVVEVCEGGAMHTLGATPQGVMNNIHSSVVAMLFTGP